jgi:selenide,water dikinase
MKRRLLLVGGGHAHVEVLRRFGLRPEPNVEITLINAGRHTVYSGMLPGLVAGHYGWRACFIDLEVLARFANARLLRDIATGLDLERKLVHCADAAEVAYDVVSIDVGSVANTQIVPHSERHGLALKPVQRFLSAWDGLVHEAGSAELDIAIVGAGAAGVELSLSMQHRMQQRVPDNRAKFSLITLTPEILPDHNPGVRRRMERVLRFRGVTIKTSSHVVGVAERALLLEGGSAVAADRVVWATGPAAPRWLGGSGLRTDERGFVLVKDSLQSLSHAEVFAAGDIATMVNHPRPKSGVYAVRQGPPLASNLRASLRGEPPRAYEPQAVALQLITTGDRNAIASWGSLCAEGSWVWRWKDAIDRRFVARYRPQSSSTK